MQVQRQIDVHICLKHRAREVPCAGPGCSGLWASGTGSQLGAHVGLGCSSCYPVSVPLAGEWELSGQHPLSFSTGKKNNNKKKFCLVLNLRLLKWVWLVLRTQSFNTSERHAFSHGLGALPGHSLPGRPGLCLPLPGANF